jgi:(5R)-carbapenem-3-carboxylate synthase
MYNKLLPVLPTGFGVYLSQEEFYSLTSYQIRMLAARRGFVLAKDVDFDDKNNFKTMVASYGNVVEYVGEKKKVGFGYKDVLELNGEKGKIVTGRGELSLHADGGLLQTRVDIAFLYAVETRRMQFQGATTVCDHELAYQEMPIHLKKILDEEVFEYQVEDKSYYVDASPDGWFKVPVYVDYGWCNKMLIYFPFTENNPPSWKSRVAGFSDKQSQMFFDELKAHMTQQRYYYKHFWSKGDLLILDNRRTLHAREAYDEDSLRILYRGQTVDPEQ